MLATVGLWSAVLAAQLPMPAGAVNDFAGVLTADEERALTELVQGVEDATTAEIAVATVTGLDGMSVDEYATRLFAEWGVGQADKDNGVLILVAPTAREMRIEVGYGLEGVLPDGLAGQIIRETFLPKFRENQYGAGIVEGTTRVAAIVRRNEPLTAEALAALDQTAGNPGVGIAWVIVPFLSIFIVIGFGMIGAGLGSRAFTAVMFGLIFGGVPFLIVQAFTEGLVAWGVTGVALLAAVVGYRIGRRPSFRKSMRGSSDTSKSGWVWGGTSGSSGGGGSSSGSSGGSSGGSSSSFGGGSSGGGGASGRW